MPGELQAAAAGRAGGAGGAGERRWGGGATVWEAGAGGGMPRALLGKAAAPLRTRNYHSVHALGGICGVRGGGELRWQLES